MPRGTDLFVVCKKCGNEVSPYITECPYCGTRLRKRAPRIDRPADSPPTAAKRAAPRLGRLRKDEIPGIRPDRRPYATLTLVLAAFVVSLLWKVGIVALDRLAVVGRLDGEWWRLASAPFTYENTGYMFAAVGSIALFGWLLERRQGPIATLLVFFLGACGGLLLASLVETDPIALGGNGAALALLAAWAIPDVRARRRGEEVESDGIGVAMIAAVLLLLPAAVGDADAVAGVGGALIGLGVGAAIEALKPGR